MQTNFNKITAKYLQDVDKLEREVKSKQIELKTIQNKYEQEIKEEMSSLIQENPYFKTRDGYIKIDEVDYAYVGGLARFCPRISVVGFYIRGGNYGYYDNCAGFLLTDLEPSTKEVFLDNVKIVTENILSRLPYKPNQYFREEGDEFDDFLYAAKKGGIDIEYYPEVKVE
jgi:hypothetical protein